MKKNTRKRNVSTKKTGLRRTLSPEAIQQHVTVHFLEILIMVKLFHWKTHNYATHKATDELYEKLNELFDKFVEVLLGKTNIRTDLLKRHTISLIDLSTNLELIHKIKQFMNHLVSFNNIKSMNIGENTDLYNIRDEILGECNKFLYLLSFT